MLDGTYYFECSCGSPEHTIRFTLDKAGTPPLIYCDFYLEHYLPWYKRIIIAVKYIFRLPPQDEHFANWHMDAAEAVKLRDMCEDFLKYKVSTTNE